MRHAKSAAFFFLTTLVAKIAAVKAASFALRKLSEQPNTYLRLRTVARTTNLRHGNIRLEPNR